MPLVIDGDGLFAVAWSADGRARAARRSHGPTVLTPHDGEYTLLTGAPTRRRSDRRRPRARRRLGCTVLLKGPTTVVADPTGDVLVVDNGDERLATAGTGDVLAGMIGALLASGSARCGPRRPLHGCTPRRRAAARAAG